MTLYRVFPYDALAPPSQPGGALYTPGGAAGRISNPDLYHELYLSNSAVGAVSEAFGRFNIWTHATFAQGGRPYALGTFELPDRAAICDLNNAGRLSAYELRPSDVVARKRSATQTWAARIHRSKKWIGIAWWSRYDSCWRSLALWNREELRLERDPEVLDLEHAVVQEAAALLPRAVEAGP